MIYGTLRIISPDGQVREHSLENPTIGIGRSPENTVVIDHVSVGRRHARIVIDSGNAFLEDLGSEGGTFLGAQQLAPGERHRLGDSGFRIGEVDALFIAPQAIGPTSRVAAAAPAGALPDMAPAQSLTVKLNGPDATVEPGGVTTAALQVQNRGSLVDEVSIRVEELPPGWAEVSRPALNLLPNARDEVTITFRPPKSTQASAGSHNLAVVVTSAAHGTEVRAIGVLNVGSFAGFSLALDPLRSDGKFTVKIENVGNAPTALALSGQDEDKSLRFEFQALNVDVKPGERAAVPLRVKMPGAPKFGAETIKPFKVEARPSRGEGAPAAASGQLRVKPPLQAWKVPVLALLVLAGLAGGGVTYAAKCEAWELPGCADETPKLAGADGSPATAGRTETPAPTPTERPTVAGQSSADKTATARADATADAKAAAIATQTANAGRTATAIAAIFEQGEFEIRPNQGADLDAGDLFPLNTSITPASRIELTLQQTPGGRLLQSGIATAASRGAPPARFASSVTSSALGEGGCDKALDSAQLKSTLDPAEIEGKFVCIKTTDFRSAELHILDNTDTGVKIAFTVFN